MNTSEAAAPLKRAIDWIRENPFAAFLLAAVLSTFTYFFAFVPLYQGLTIAKWAIFRYKPEYNQEHSNLVPFVFLFLVWYHRDALAKAKKEGSDWGVLLLAFGLLIYVVAARTLQARLALGALPFLLSGSLLFLFGREVARILAFPSAFLLFLIPAAAIEQTSFRLQFVITGFVEHLSALLGIKIYSVGTTLRAVDGSWGFDISEGCSGIRSLIAMVMITAIYVHLAEKVMWKKITIFALSVLFAIIGNVGRIFTIIVIARLGFPTFAGGLYHDYSAFIIFPFALGAMVLTSRLLNADWSKVSKQSLTRPEKVTYDY